MLPDITKVLTMTTREIAELTNKDHRHVMRDAQTMFNQLEISDEGYARTWTHPQNKQTYIEYLLPKDLSMCLVSGYVAKLRLKIIRRLEELEAETKKSSLPQTFSEALQLAADQAKLIEEQAPKVEVYEKLAARNDSVITSVLAAELKTSAIALNKWLKVNGYKHMQKDLPTYKKRDWFNVIAVVDNKTGKEHVQCLITPLGQIEITKRFNKS